MPAPLLRVSLAAAALWAPPAAGLVAEKARYAFGDPDFGSGSEWVHMHIPKVAGESFRKDVAAHLPHSRFPFSGEVSYQTLRHCNCRYPKKPDGCWNHFDCDCFSTVKKNRRIISMVREPLHHLLSIYTWCKTAPEQGNRQKFAKQFPSFTQWVQDWHRHYNGSTATDHQWRTEASRYCHDPRNLQVTRFANTDEHEVCGSQGVNRHANLTLAMLNMQDTDFMGIMEAYHESLCLLHVKALGQVPPDCHCEDKETFRNYKHVAVDTHGTAEHHLDDIPNNVLREARYVTFQDRMLYRQAVYRFTQEVRKVEAEHGVKILCWDIPAY